MEVDSVEPQCFCTRSTLLCFIFMPSFYVTFVPSSLAEWSRHVWCIDLPNISFEIMEVDLSSLSAFVPEAPWYVFSLCNRMSSSLKVSHGLHGYLVKILCNITHALAHMQHTQHTEGRIDWHTSKYISAPLVIHLHYLLCAHSNYLYFIK